MNIKLLKNKNIEVLCDKTTLTPIQTVLANRGVENFDNFFNISWNSVQTPYALNDIQLAAEKIIDHARRSSVIGVLVDCDADGMMSAATLINALTAHMLHDSFGPLCTMEIKYIMHEGKEHGLSDTTAMKYIRDVMKPHLLIVPDASGTEAQYKALNDLGIEIVVLDHHDVMEGGRGNDTIVVNNQQSPEYRNKSLCGAGVVYQLLRVIDDLLHFKIAEHWLDLVAVGLVADVMDLRSDETRFLIQEGLKPENINSPFLKEAQKVLAFSLKGDYNPGNVGFYIGPLFNAVLRIGTMEEKTLLFRSLLDDDALTQIESGKRGEKGRKVDLVVETIRQATNAKGRQKRRQEKLTALIEQTIQDEQLAKNKVLILAIDDFDEEDRALSGLIANKIQEYYQRPCILMFQTSKNTYSGSVRCPSSIEAFSNFREQCIESKLVDFALGHNYAFGIQVAKNKIEELQNYFNNKYKDSPLESTYLCDFYFDAQDSEMYRAILELGSFQNLWGTGITEPLIAIKNVRVAPSTLSLMSRDKNPTLKIELPTGVECLRFKSSIEEYDALSLPYSGVEQCYIVTLVGKPSVNEWRGERTPQLFITDYEVHSVDYMF